MGILQIRNNLWQTQVCLFLFIILLLSFQSISQTTTVFTTPGPNTWVCPAGVTSVQVEAWGAGGGGGGGNGNNDGGGGGGGGGYTKNISVTVVPGTTYTITVGAGGAAGAAQTTGGTGNSSSAVFGSTTVTALGGSGGTGQTGTNTVAGGAGGIGGTFNGGTGGAGSGTNSGGGGEGACSSQDGANGSGTTGGVNTCDGGNGADGSTAQTFVGVTGNSPGGGGSGGTKNSSGGQGGSGQVIITFSCPSFGTVSPGSNQTLAACATSATLAGSAIPSGMTGLWTVVSGTATITSPTSPTSGVTGIPLNSTVTLRWTISNGVCGSSSSDVTITTSQGPGCLTYCTPDNLICGPVASAGNTYYFLIKNVTLNTINNTTPTTTCGINGYTDYYNSVSTNLNVGQSYTVSISVGVTTGASNYAMVWIDFNQDGDFGGTGEAFLVGPIASNSTASTTVQVPTTALTGNTRMRVKYIYNQQILSSWSCYHSGTYGEIEDYKITIGCDANSLNSVSGRFPADGLSLPCGSAITLSWNAHTCATNGFDLYLGTTNPPTNLVTSTTNTSYYTGNLLGNTTYYWQLRPKDGSNIGSSDVWSFITQTPINSAISQDVLGCLGSSVCLQASGGTYSNYYWFDQAVNGVPIGSGQSFCPVVTVSPTTYYVSNYSNGSPSSIDASTTATIVCSNTSSGFGNMFDILAKTANLTITGVSVMFRDVSTNNGNAGTITNRPVKIYYRTNSYIGNSSSSNGWNLLVNTTVAIANQPAAPTLVAIPNLFIPAGMIYGIYVVYDNTYLSSSGLYANTDLEVRTGATICGSEFGTTIADRTFRGTVYYNTTCSSPTIPVVVTLNSTTIPTFTELGPFCQNTTPGSLPSSSNNEILGTWSPSTISTALTGSTIYNFTPISTAAPTCAISSTMNITVNPSPVANITGTLIVCAPITSTNLTATGGGSYLWSNDLGNTAAVNITSSGSYAVTVTAENSCTAVANTTVAIINPSVSVNNTTICSGVQTTLTATPDEFGGMYLWSPGGQTTSSISVNPITTTTYSVTYTLNGCESTPDNGVVTVLQTPSVIFLSPP